VTSFRSLGVSQPLVDALAAAGITEAFPIQALTIRDALAGRDVLGKAKTGSGKTLAFGLPLLDRIPPAAPRRPGALVLVPTRELAAQVAGVLEPLAAAKGFGVLAVYGGVGMEPQVRALAGGVEVVIATPGRCIDLLERGALIVDGLAVVVLDEADRMADMGFLPQVQKILYRIRHPHQTMLFSATLDRGVDRVVARYLTDPVLHEVASREPTVEEMRHHFLRVHEMDRVRVLAAIAAGVTRTLVFCNTKRGADRLTERLRREGVRAGAIHGDLRQDQRERALADFARGRLPVLVATDVAARGIHVDDVDVVVHFDPPEDHKAYLHRSGRTARAGRTGVAVMFVLWNQENEARVIQRRLGLDLPMVEVFSNDPRLADLAGWDPRPEAETAAASVAGA
jgi:superfamily II DNA/RNA helicase